MNSKIVYVSIIVFLAYLTSGEGMSLRGLGIDPRCRCVETESRRIGKYIESVLIFPASSHCKDTEIIATLKSTKQKICLDPAAEWVIKVIEKKSKSIKKNMNV